MRYLADFMKVTCSPPKHRFLLEEDKQERAERVRISLLESNHHLPMKRTDISHPRELRATLQAFDKPSPNDNIYHSVFVVEDLSRDVIEILGHHFDIDPQFFRAHINDYIWYNTRDPWIELPDLAYMAAKRDFFQMRYVQPRYFRSEESLERARTEAGGFNVLRRVDKELDTVLKLDEPGSVIGMVRSKATFWIRPKNHERQGTLGQS